MCMLLHFASLQTYEMSSLFYRREAPFFLGLVKIAGQISTMFNDIHEGVSICML